MKVLLITHKFFPDIGGIESISMMLAHEFTKAGYSVSVMTWTEDPSATSFPFTIIRKPGVGKVLKAISDSEIVFENNICLQLSWPLFFRRKPHVVGLQTWLSAEGDEKSLKKRLKKIWLNRADNVISCSEAIRIQIHPSSTTIGNPYDNILFRRLPQIQKEKDYIFLGRLVSDKGVSLAISAFYEMISQKNSQFEGASLTIVGDGEEKQILEKQVNELGIASQVHFTGSMRGEALVKILNNHKYLLVPSTWNEPFGVVALEGLACGCIPIVSNGGGLPDAVGKAGVTFKKGDQASLVETMVRLRKDKAVVESVKLAADEHLKKHQSAHISSQYIKVLQRVLHTKK